MQLIFNLNDLGEPRNATSALVFAVDTTWEQNAMDNCNLSKAHTSPTSTVIKNAFDKKQKQGLEMTPYEIEQLAKQTLLHSSEVEIWVRHLSDVRKHRQAGAQKATYVQKCRLTRFNALDE